MKAMSADAPDCPRPLEGSDPDLDSAPLTQYFQHTELTHTDLPNDVFRSSVHHRGNSVKCRTSCELGIVQELLLVFPREGLPHHNPLTVK